MRFLSIVSLFLCAAVIKSDGDRENELYIIRGVPSGLVLDSIASNRVTMQFYSGLKAQLWKFVRGRRAGLYTIVNNQTGSVLDFSQGDSDNYLITNPPSDTLRQQWFLHSNGRIVNAENLMNMDVQYGKKVPGTPVIVFRENGGENQEFTLQRKEGDYGKDSDENGDGSNEGNYQTSSEGYINKIDKDIM